LRSTPSTWPSPLHRPDLTSHRAPHDGAVVLAHRHAHHDDEACRSTREHPPSAANTVRAAQDSLLLTNQERWAIDQQPFLQGYLAIDSLWLFINNRNLIGGGTPVLTGPAFIDKSNIDAIAEYAANGTR
jgi:hypothetical protein